MRALPVALACLLAAVFAAPASAATPQFGASYLYDQFAGGVPPSGASLQVGNLDGNARADLVVAENGAAWVLRGTAETGFPEPTLFGPPALTSVDAINAALADFTQDGLDDILEFDTTGGDILLAPADGFGVALGCGCSSAIDIGTVTGATGVLLAAADLDVDGDVDFVLTDDTANSARVFSGIGGYQPSDLPTLANTIPLGQDIDDVVIGNFDTTSVRPEIAVLLADGNLRVYEDTAADFGYAGLQTLAATGGGSAMHRLATGDVTGDGLVDLVASDTPATGTLLVLPGQSSFGAVATQTPLAGAGPIAVRDLNADGRAEVVAATTINSTLEILEGSSSGALTNLGSFDPGGAAPTAVAAADFDGDGRADLVSVDSGVGLRLTRNRSLAAIGIAGSGALGSQTVGTLGPATAITLTNTGAAPLRVTSVRSDSDDFVISGETCAGETIAAGATCSARVRFAPTAAGARTGNLTVSGNTAVPAVVVLSGTGTALPPATPVTGPVGPAGPTGPAGPAGRPGSAPVSRGHARCRVRGRRIQCVVYNAKSRPWKFRGIRQGRLGNRRLAPGRYRLVVIHTDASGELDVYRRIVRVPE